MVQGSFKDQGTFRRETAPIINKKINVKIIIDKNKIKDDP